VISSGHPRVALQQRVLASYRVPFLDALASACPGGLSVFAGQPRPDESIDTGARPTAADYREGKNIHLLNGKLYFCWQTGLMRWLRDWQPDVLIMEANPRYPTSRQAIAWMKARAGRVIGWGLGSPVPSGRFSRARLWLRARFIRQFDALVTYSQAGTDEYAQLGYPRHQIFSAPNAVASRPIHSLPTRPDRYQANRPALVFVGRLQSRKLVDVLIQACALLLPAVQPRLWIVGDGPQRRELENLAARVYPETRFFGAQHGDDLEKLLQEADLFILPGTGGLAIQQAMSFGLPVISGKADGTQSDLVREENGWVLPDESPQTLSRLIKDALGDIRRLRRMGAASYRIVSEEINLENMVSAFLRAIAFATSEDE
jgi:glycosyltransferase involved in cell wall biosynthesis